MLHFPLSSERSSAMRISSQYFLVAGLVMAIALPACTTVNPYTREEETASATTGAVIGAVAGAVVGAAAGDDSRDRRRRALLGAGVGALAGGSVGYYMDVQEAKLRQQLEGTGVSVTRDGDNIILNMPGNITFQTNSSNLNTSFHEVLNSVTLVLKEYEKTLIEVAGHTDSTGAAAYNHGLSEQRAYSVGKYLIGQGISQSRVLTIGYGETRPVASNDTPAGRAQNRRVELTLIPVTED